MKKHIAIAAAGLLLLTGCGSEAKTSSHNLSKAADNFEVQRRVVFVNGITDKYLLTVEGRCSIIDSDGQLEVTCKIADDRYKKHYLGLSDNVTYFIEQTDAAGVDPYHYRVMFRPESIIPGVDVETSADLEQDG